MLGWLRDPELLARVADGVLDDESARLLAKSWGDDLCVDDVPLLDELRYLLGDPPIATDEVELDFDEDLAQLESTPPCRR